MAIRGNEAFGYHTSLQFQTKIEELTAETYGEKHRSKGTEMHQLWEKKYKVSLIKNLSIALGYLPVIGTIVGIVKRIFIHSCEKTYLSDPKSFGKCKPHLTDFLKLLKIRTWVEITSLGFLLIVPDIFFTLRRNMTKS